FLTQIVFKGVITVADKQGEINMVKIRSSTIRYIFLLCLTYGFANDEVCQEGSSSFEYITLRNGELMPRVGFGTAGLRPTIFGDIIHEALKARFRHFDGAEALEWYNDPELGKALATYMPQFNLARKD